MRRLALLLLLLLGVSVAGISWWTAEPQTAQQAVGWCIEQRGREVEFVRCVPGRPRPKVVGTSGQPIDFMSGDLPLGSCPMRVDRVVQSPVPGDALLCLDTKPGDGNRRTRLAPTTRSMPLTPPTTRPPGEEVVGLCLGSPRRTQGGIVQGEFIRCSVKPGPGFGSRGEVIGVTYVRVDTVGQRPSGPFGPDCPVATDQVVRAQLPSGEVGLLCLDNEPAYGNTRS